MILFQRKAAESISAPEMMAQIAMIQISTTTGESRPEKGHSRGGDIDEALKEEQGPALAIPCLDAGRDREAAVDQEIGGKQ